MSLFESGDSIGEVSLKYICEGKKISKATKDVNLRNLAHLIIRGGWPGNISYSSDDSRKVVSEYIDLIINDDLYRLDSVNRYKHKAKLLLKSLARNESTTVPNATLRKDIKEIDDEPFSTNIRLCIRVKQSEKRHFADPSISCALLNLTEEKLINDLEIFGFLFEAMVKPHQCFV